MRAFVGLLVLLALSGCAHAPAPAPVDPTTLDLGPAPDPHPASAAVQEAESLIASERLPEAVTRLEAAVGEAPTDPRAWFTLGVARTLTQAADEAEVAFRRAIALDDQYAEAWNELGLLLRAIGRSDEGIAALRRSVAARPDFDDAHYNLALALEDGNQLEEARASYERAVQGSLGSDPVVRYNRAGLLLRVGDRDAARTELMRARTLAHGRADVLHAVGRALLRLDAAEAAADSLAEAVDVSTEPGIELLVDASVAAREAERRGPALDFARRAAVAAPELARAQALLAVTAFEAGQLDTARGALARARALDTGGTLRADLDRLEARIQAAH